jgi:hypothetical protein
VNVSSVKKIIFLVNLTSAVYISSSGYTLTFGAKSEGSPACRHLRDADEDGVWDNDMIYTHVLNKGGHGIRSPLDGL